MNLHEAKFWETTNDSKVRCLLCRFNCLIAQGHRGRCGVRENHGGVLYSLVYGKTISENVDPIEKKPLYHFYPGSKSLSIATVGCNFSCLHCQNYQISQWSHDHREIIGTDMSPGDIVRHAVETGSSSIAYTYTEPTIFFEYAYDTAVKAKATGLRNVFVSNGYTTTQALETIAPFLDAANIDLKGFSEESYKRVTGASLYGVLDCLKDYRRLGIWLEVTTLVIPGFNDSRSELQQIASFIFEELGADVPWHVSAFFPTYKMTDRPPTPLETLLLAKKVGQEVGLRFVYVGNVNDPDAGNTICPSCGQTVIRRSRFRATENKISNQRCKFCRHEIPGIYSPG